MEMPKPAPTNPDREIILIVDDEPAVLKVMKIVLEKSGFQVVLAGNGAEALEIFEQMRDQIRILITDMAMPGMNGLDLIRAIRNLNPAVHIVATTGMTTPDQMQAISDAGVSHVLSKPCSSHQLIELIRKLFSKP
jgi:CheY-like chemotaxis protein